ncbi:MAG: protein kinase [Myxococcota bacterium]|nr:protein kinase [Myxococcota bacterium]MDW8362277.1 protein kinase [Myxococcales bacterium]
MTDVQYVAHKLGQVIAGKYRLRWVLVVAAVGALDAAVHVITERHVAVKRLDPGAGEVEGDAARFLREAHAASAIGYPAIVDVLDAGQLPERPLYLVLELPEGEDIGAATRRGELTPAEIVEIGLQLTIGRAAPHDRGIVHRDVEPENVFLTRDERSNLRVKLLDFGVAKSSVGADLFTTRDGAANRKPVMCEPGVARR